MQRWFETVFDTLTGAAISGAEVWLWNVADNSLATIYNDAAGTSPALNPIPSDSNGFVEAYVPDGLYRVEFKVAGIILRTIHDVPIFDLADMRADLNDMQTRMATAEASITANTANIAANTASIATKLAKASNLSDLASVGTSRTNLSVYSKAEVDAAIAGHASPAVWGAISRAVGQDGGPRCVGGKRRDLCRSDCGDHGLCWPRAAARLLGWFAGATKRWPRSSEDGRAGKALRHSAHRVPDGGQRTVAARPEEPHPAPGADDLAARLRRAARRREFDDLLAKI
jgi:hypothetical protein